MHELLVQQRTRQKSRSCANDEMPFILTLSQGYGKSAFGAPVSGVCQGIAYCSLLDSVFKLRCYIIETVAQNEQGYVAIQWCIDASPIRM